MKKLTAIILAALAAFGVWAETETVDGIAWTYRVVDGKAEIYNNGNAAIYNTTSGAITIPSTLGGKPVTSIGYRALSGCTALASVTIPDGVTNIGEDAFYGCSKLTSVTIPDSVTRIISSAFSSCSDSLFDTTTIPGVKLVDRWAVGNIGSISGHLNLAGVRGIGEWAFYCCSGLTSVTIPNGVTSIGSGAFYGCSGLTSVTIPDSVTSIGKWAFSVCRGLTSVTIPDSVTSIGKGAFYGCNGLTSVRIPDGMTNVGEWLDKLFKITVAPNLHQRGTVSGDGSYAYGAKATIKAKAKSGYVFAGWFTDKACTKKLNPKGYDNRKPTVKVAMPAKNTTVYAKFVTKADAKKSLKFSSATKKLAKTATKATAGKAFSLALGIKSASLPTVTAKGLPKGLSIDKTTGAITGVGTVPGSYATTVTVKDAAGNKITQNVKITVETAAFAKGTFYGTALPGVNDEDSWSYLKFSVGKTGNVTGKVKHGDKWHSFSSSLASCTATKATFKPQIKIGSKTFKPGTIAVKIRKAGGLSLSEAANSKGTFTAQKKPNLVKAGKPLAALVEWSDIFDRDTPDSGLTKKKDRLEVFLGSGDAITVSGIVGGKKLAAISWASLVSDVEAVDGETVYTLYVDIVDASLKYQRTLVLQVSMGDDGELLGVTPVFL